MTEIIKASEQTISRRNFVLRAIGWVANRSADSYMTHVDALHLNDTNASTDESEAVVPNPVT